MKIKITLDLDLSQARDRDTYLAIYEVGYFGVEPAKAEQPAKAEPAKAEPAKAEPAKAEPAKAEPEVTLEDIRKLLQLKAPDNYDACFKVLQDHGASNASNLQSSRFSLVLTALQAI